MSAEKVIVLSTHILEEVDAVCTRATIIANGRIASDGTPEELLRRSRMHNALRLSLANTDGDGVAETLRSIPDVSHAEVTSRSDGVVELLLLPSGTASLAGPVSAAAHAKGWHVTGMQVERGRLDNVFRAITTGQEGAGDG